jgi:hypothetical protein
VLMVWIPSIVDRLIFACFKFTVKTLGRVQEEIIRSGEIQTTCPMPR